MGAENGNSIGFAAIGAGAWAGAGVGTTTGDECCTLGRIRMSFSVAKDLMLLSSRSFTMIPREIISPALISAVKGLSPGAPRNSSR